jgi:hypothetical protein
MVRYMKKLDPKKLHVEYRPEATATEPVLGRKYTLTHSDTTAELFLTIGTSYAYDKINKMRDEVLGEWRKIDSTIFIYIYLYVGGKISPAIAAVRNKIFRRELPLALEAIRYGDRSFFEAHPELDNAPIWVYFDSEIPYFKRFENWLTPADYK